MEPLNYDINNLKRYLIAQAQQVHLKEGTSDLRDIQELTAMTMDLSHAYIIEYFCKHLSKLFLVDCQNLLSAGRLTDALRILGGCQNLSDVSLSVCFFKSLYDIPNLKNLKRLFVTEILHYDSRDLEKRVFINLPQLESFGVLNHINNYTVTALKSLKHLTELSFANKFFSNDQITLLVSNLKHLTSLSFTSCALGDVDLETISEHIQVLESFEISSHLFTEKGLECLNKYQTVLKKLTIKCSESISAEWLFSFYLGFKALKSLTIYTQKFTMEINQLPKHLKHLESFRIRDYAFIEIPPYIIGFVESASNSNLKELSVYKQYTNKTAQAIYQNLPHLKNLNLFYGSEKRVSNSGSCYASKLKELRTLKLDWNCVQDVGVSKIMRNLRQINCNLSSNKISSKWKRNIKLLQMNVHMVIHA